MILTILLLFAAAIGLYLSISTQRITPILLTLILIGGLLLALFPLKEFEIKGIYFYMASLIPIFIYGFTLKSKAIIPRMIVLLMPASMFTYWLWHDQHWHGNTSFALYFTVILAIVSIIYRKELRKEWGMLLIISMDAITLIIENLLKQLS